MKAYIIEQTGGAEVLQLRDITPPTPSENEVLIRVKAFGLNRAEIYRRSGKMGEISAPCVLGIEAVGEVISDPSGTFHTGQRVATVMGGMQFTRAGSYAEQVTVMRSNVIDLSQTALPWEELASLPEAYLTVWGALSKSLNIQSGQTILIRGATSSVGIAAITYAKAHGLRVVATTRSTDRVDALKAYGADHVVIDDGNISGQIRALYPQGIDAVLEVVGAQTLRDSIKALQPFGAVTVIGLLGGAPVLENFHLMQDLPGAVRLNFFPSGLLGTPALPLRDAPLAWITQQIETGKMPSIRAQTFDFSDIPHAHRLMESNQTFGKFVVRV